MSDDQPRWDGSDRRRIDHQILHDLQKGQKELQASQNNISDRLTKLETILELVVKNEDRLRKMEILQASCPALTMVDANARRIDENKKIIDGLELRIKALEIEAANEKGKAASTGRIFGLASGIGASVLASLILWWLKGG
jgi:peptidoglycan hydrolase CwlO-like protein